MTKLLFLLALLWFPQQAQRQISNDGEAHGDAPYMLESGWTPLLNGKAKYSSDLPRFFAYATKVATRYRELQPLLSLLEPLSGMKAATGFSMR